MKLLPLTAALLSVGLSTQLLADEVSDRIDKLEQEISALKSRPATAPAAAPATGSSSISTGGYIKLDAQITEYSDGRGPAGASEDFLIPSLIPVGGESGDPKTHFNAKESRFWIKGKTQTDAGEIAGHIEIDFELSGQGDERISNSYAPRLRHAYFTWDKWLFGQTWSTFFNVSTLPDFLDFVGPVGTIFVRQSQVRYTTGNFMLAAENPQSTLYTGQNATASSFDDNAMPDLIARYNITSGKSNYSAAFMVRELAYDTGTDIESEYGYALSLAGKMAIGDSGSDLRVMVNAGNALGRYMGLNAFRAGAVELDGSIELIDEIGAFIAYRQMWNQQWRSSFGVSMAEADNPDSAGNAAKSYATSHLNLVYQPVAPLELGGELILGSKELEDGTDGDITRLQFSAKYSF